MKIAIVGGAIGGLFAANALVRRGIEAAVYERAPKSTGERAPYFTEGAPLRR